ncbi:MAG: preprotein translocase subunit SecE [Ignavibacteriales bacterium]|nr:preprotein translocase subunit SecE [Ignavibacteriales bacterium]
MKQKIINYFNDVVKEMKKVTWPTKDELKESTLIVIITCILVAIFTYIVDMSTAKIFEELF